MAYYDDLTYKRDEIKEYLDERIDEMKEYDIKNLKQLIKDGDIHNEIFNTDYYIIIYYIIMNFCYFNLNMETCQQWVGQILLSITSGLIYQFVGLIPN